MAFYPIVENDYERQVIDKFVATLPDSMRRARDAHARIMTELGRPTRMVAQRRYPTFFVPFNRAAKTFDVVQTHHLRKVLLLGLRFRRRPEEILALWQNEGLPAYHSYEGEDPGPFERVSQEIVSSNGKRVEPNSEEQARAWAVSAVLWMRWGLDQLIPHRPAREDNRPLGLQPDEHARVFAESFAKECAPALRESPWSYLVNDIGPIELKRQNGIWRFRTHAEYQTAALALQTARFVRQTQRIPAVYEGFELPVYTRPVFAAALYLHYNSQNAEKHMEMLVRRMIGALKREVPERSEYHAGDMLRFFTGSPIPRDIEDYVIRIADLTTPAAFNSHSWVNALRYELLRRVYAELFAEVTVEEPISPFLVDGL